MYFIDEEHELFFINKLKELHQYGKTDVYYTSLVYTLGVCETTRKHFDTIINTKKGEINIDALSLPWQTRTSEKVTRMAFSLWNGCMYDSKEDIENNKMSKGYIPSEIFACSYAPYFYENVKLRYPEYTKELNKNNKIKNYESER